MTSSLFTFDGSGHYSLPDYNKKRPFSSFLPGIAGPWGVPMWVFYVNRGQAVTSFGVESKDSPIMEFQSANKAYQRTAMEGFRTFIKWKFGEQSGYYEPFSNQVSNVSETYEISSQTMSIGMSELTLTDENPALGLKTGVLYFTLPSEPFAALARQVTVTNTGNNLLELEILDGIPALIPYGVDNGGLKHVGRTLEAWMRVFHLESGLPFFHLGATPGDTAEVHEIQAGHFVLGFTARKDKAAPLPVIVDPQIIFGMNTSLTTPDALIAQSLDTLEAATQVTVGKTPCAFFGQRASLTPGEEITLYALFGHVNGYENIANERQRITNLTYFSRKRAENQNLIQTLTDTVATQTADPRFDAYVRQTFLDNILRGGWPVLLGDGENSCPYHIYSRKHGDLERDYNHFFLAAEFYSQGNGNFRDVCQNRRCDVLLEPRVGAHNIQTFLSLIQLDGYNPLVVQGTKFTLTSEQVLEILELTESPSRLAVLLKKKFTPGGLLKSMADHNIVLKVSYEEFIKQVLRHAEPHLEAEYGEGFWVDHWTYILDLIENFLAVYPDRKADLLFGEAAIPFYQSQAQVRPRHERYVLSGQGPRQYHALAHIGESGWTRTPDGEIYSTSVFGKLILLAVVKFGTLDPQGMGIEMEAGKPGWYDALNGLPGLFGSSMPETYELLRLLCFLRESLADLGEDYQTALPTELAQYLEALAALTETNADQFSWWEEANHLQEGYRAKIYQEFSGQKSVLSNSALDGMLATFETRLREGISCAEAYLPGEVPPTYFRYEVTEYEILKNEDGIPRVDGEGRPYLRVKGVRSYPLPPFLEGAVRAMKVEEDSGTIHAAVRGSGLYDPVLKMYKVNAPLGGEPHEIGRARAFTPGWLENESVWLHMEYKYLLEILKAGLYEEFFDDFKNVLIPFQPPERYGRSPLENSSFIVSSAHPDKSLHGNGFVARLSGATAEFVEMWTLMMAGRQPFRMQDGELVLRLRPTLPAWLFDEQDQVRFNFLGRIPVTYHNSQRVDTWKTQPQKITLQLNDGKRLDFDTADILAPYAVMVRERNVKWIDVYL